MPFGYRVEERRETRWELSEGQQIKERSNFPSGLQFRE